MTTVIRSLPARSLADATKGGWVAYVYLLRVQLMVAVALVLGPPFALSSPLLNGIFDLDYGAFFG